MTRNDFTLFPRLDELLEIIAKEQQRPLPKGKDAVHYPDFTEIEKLLHKFEIDYSFFSENFALNELKNKNLPEVARKLSDSAVRTIVDAQVNHIELFDEVYDYLAEEDVLEKSDILFVFGSKSNTRIEKAVELMKQGYAKLLVVSGNAPIYDKGYTITEAERLKEYALSKGITSDQIIIENTSISVPDNVRSSLNLLDKEKIVFKSIIIVNSPYSQRRGWAHFKKYLPDEIKVLRVNSKTIEKYSKNGWYTNEDGVRVIMNESIKMKIAVILNTA